MARFTLLALALAAPLALAQTPRSHEEVTAFVKAAGFEVCESVPNDPPDRAKSRGAIGKHLIEVAKDCAKRDPKNANVIFAFEFDTVKNRDMAVAQFVEMFEASFVDFGNAWAIGDRAAIFVSGPARGEIGLALQEEFLRRQAAATK